MWIRRKFQRLLAPVVFSGLLVSVHVGQLAAQADANEVLATALAEAESTDRQVFLHSGADWCGWCKRLERWLEREDIAPIFSKDFVEVKIDVEAMEGGQELMDS